MTFTPNRRMLGCALVAAALLAGCSDDPDSADGASPTPSPSTTTVVAEELAEGTQKSALDVRVDGPVQVNMRRITIPPGAGTGRHCHHGNLIATVEAGTLTHYAPIYDDGVREYRTGDSLVEGPDYVHEGRNEGTGDVVLMVTYVTPTGDPLAETDLARCEA